ncbi:MAG: hypothetical protein AAF492_06730, partial [Verrucomicrobiota bacterium]
VHNCRYVPDTIVVRTQITAGAEWNYLDDGSNQGTAWREVGFNDVSWTNGLAKFGYGDGNEVTTIDFGTNAAAKHITTYFRNAFVMQPGVVWTNTRLHVLYDDGMVVYHNGVEIARALMGTGNVAFNTQAGPTSGGTDETTFFEFVTGENQMVNGLNVVAVEIHQTAPTSSDLGFDMAMVNIGHTRRLEGGPSNITMNAADLGGVLEDVGMAPTDVFVYWGTNDGGTVKAAWDSSMNLGVQTEGVLNLNAGGLTPGETYFYRYYASNAFGDSWAATGKSFTTFSGIPEIVNEDRIIGSPIVERTIAAGSTWNYLDDGSDQGTAWRDLLYDDSGWSNGPAQLGYGDGDESTVVSFGPQANPKFTTTYFRHIFESNPRRVWTNTQVRLLRDDGAVVYHNGIEIMRENMTNGVITYTNFSLATAGGADEMLFFSTNTGSSLVQDGSNVIAVEVHQANAGSSDLSMELEMYCFGHTATPIGGPTNITFSSATLGGVLKPGLLPPTQVFLYWGTNDGGFVQSAWDNVIPLGVQGEGLLQTNLTGLSQGTAYFYRYYATNMFGDDWSDRSNRFMTVSGAPVVTNPVPVDNVVSQLLVSTGSVWRFLDDGSDQGTTWRNSGFDDASWSNGPAQLGYGDGDEATVVGFGPNAQDKYRTTYFRRTFPVTNASHWAGLFIRLLRDDGAVVYVNGVEVFRSNMPTGIIDYLTFSSAGVNGAVETNFVTGLFNSNVLVEGMNTVAVEIHQVNTNSSDISFDLELIARGRSRDAFGATNMTFTSAEVCGTVRSSGDAPATVAVVYDTVDAGDNPGAWSFMQPVGPSGTGEVCVTLTNLNPGETIYFRFVVSNAFGRGIAPGSGRFSTTPGSPRVTNEVWGASNVFVNFISTGSVWRYLDDGSDQGTAWRNLGFDDSSWSNGAAQLGYGDGDEATVIGFGTNANN